jgi:hypothetical protein
MSSHVVTHACRLLLRLMWASPQHAATVVAAGCNIVACPLMSCQVVSFFWIRWDGEDTVFAIPPACENFIVLLSSSVFTSCRADVGQSGSELGSNVYVSLRRHRIVLFAGLAHCWVSRRLTVRPCGGRLGCSGGEFVS